MTRSPIELSWTAKKDCKIQEHIIFYDRPIKFNFLNIFSSFSIRSISSIFSFDANFRDISIPRPSHHSHNFILPVIINPQIIVHISQKFYLNCSHSSSSQFATKINFCTSDTKFQTSKSFKYCTKTQTIKKPTLFSRTPISFYFTHVRLTLLS